MSLTRLLLLSAVIVTGAAVQPAAAATYEQQLATPIHEVAIQDEDLAAAVAKLKKLTGCPLVADQSALASGTTVSYVGKQITLRVALDGLTRMAGLTYGERKGTIVISAAAAK